MDYAMSQWDGFDNGRAIDYTQWYFGCCGSLTYSDWENVDQFEDYAEVSIFV